MFSWKQYGNLRGRLIDIGLTHPGLDYTIPVRHSCTCTFSVLTLGYQYHIHTNKDVRVRTWRIRETELNPC